MNENLDCRKSSNFFIMNEIFDTVIDSIKRDDVDFIKQFFEEDLSHNNYYLVFETLPDTVLPLQSFLLDVSAAINSLKCTSFIINHINRIEDEETNQEIENVEEEEEEEMDENGQKIIDQPIPPNEGQVLTQKEEFTINIDENNFDILTLLTIITDNENTESNEDNFVSLCDWYIRTNCQKEDLPEDAEDALYIASNSEILSIVEYLLSYGIDASRINSKFGTTVYNGAVLKLNYDLIELYDDYFINQTADSLGRTPLHIAAKLKNGEMTTFLLDLGGDPFQTDWRGFTPLHVASKNNDVALIEILIDHGAQIDQPDKNGRTPLHIAALYGKLAACQTLYNLEASLDPIDMQGMTPLNLATWRKKKQVARFLESVGATNSNMEGDQYQKKRKSSKIVFEAVAKKNRRSQIPQ